MTPHIKLNINLPYDPAILPLVICPREMKIHFYRKTCEKVFTTVLCIITKNFKSHPNIFQPKNGQPWPVCLNSWPLFLVPGGYWIDSRSGHMPGYGLNPW